MNLIKGILDTSALVGYAERDLAAFTVGEFVQMIDESEDYVGIPVGDFVRAFTTISGREHGREALLRIAKDATYASAGGGRRQSPFLMLALLDTDAVAVAELDAQWPGRGHAILEARRGVDVIDNRRVGTVVASFDLPPGINEFSDSVQYLDLSVGWDDI